MKVLFAIKSLNVPGGGAERVLVLIANGLAERGHDVAVLTFDPPGASFYPLHDAVRRFDLDMNVPGTPTPRGRLLLALPRMRSIAKSYAPDLAVGFMHSMYVPFGLALAGSGRRVVASEHATARHFSRRTAQRMLVRLLAPLFVAKTVPSEGVRSDEPESIRRRTIVLPNPLDLDDFARLATTEPATPPVLLTVGRFMEEKNQLELIRAFDLVAGELPEWRLRLVGEGEMRPQVEAAIAASPYKDRIELPGATRDIVSEYARAAIVVVPSRHESFGMVTVEAQAAGRPVLGFADCQGTNELVSDRIDGLLVDGGTSRVRNLAEGIRHLAQDPGLRMRLGAAGPAAAARFGHRRVVDSWEAFFREQVGASSTIAAARE